MLSRIKRIEEAKLANSNSKAYQDGLSTLSVISKEVGDKKYRSILQFIKSTKSVALYMLAIDEILKSSKGFADYILANCRTIDQVDIVMNHMTEKLYELVIEEESSSPGSLTKVIKAIRENIMNQYPGNTLSRETIKGSGYSKYLLNKEFIERMLISINKSMDTLYDSREHDTHIMFRELLPELLTRGSIQATNLNEATTSKGKTISAMYRLYNTKHPAELAKKLYLLTEVTTEMCKDPDENSKSSLYVLLMYIMKKLENNRSYMRMYADELRKDFDITQKYYGKATGKTRKYIGEISEVIKEKYDHVRVIAETKAKDVDYLVEFGLDEAARLIAEYETGNQALLEGAGIGSKVVTKSKEALRKLNKIKYKEKKFWDKIEGAEDKLVKDWKSAKEEEYNDKVIDGSLNLIKTIRKLSLYVGGLLIPGIPQIISAIAIVTKIATHKKAKKAARQRIIRELEIELKIVKEKIADASSDGNRDAKYKLMRLESELEKNLDKIKHSVKAQV